MKKGFPTLKMSKLFLSLLVVAIFCATFSTTEGMVQYDTVTPSGLVVNVDENTVESCDDSRCDSDCRSRNWDGGFCAGGYCMCYKSEFSSLKEIDNKPKLVSLSSLGVDTNLWSCVDSSCDSKCRGRGWKGGVCVQGSCYCWK